MSACAHDPYGYGSPGYGGAYGYHGDEWSGHDMDELSQLDPWLEDTREGRVIVDRSLGEVYYPEAIRDLNIRFRRFADRDGDLRLTDYEIRLALVRCATAGWNW
jgi:hypothetical protein